MMNELLRQRNIINPEDFPSQLHLGEADMKIEEHVKHLANLRNCLKAVFWEMDYWRDDGQNEGPFSAWHSELEPCDSPFGIPPNLSAEEAYKRVTSPILVNVSSIPTRHHIRIEGRKCTPSCPVCNRSHDLTDPRKVEALVPEKRRKRHVYPNRKEARNE